RGSTSRPLRGPKRRPPSIFLALARRHRQRRHLRRPRRPRRQRRSRKGEEGRGKRKRGTRVEGSGPQTALRGDVVWGFLVPRPSSPLFPLPSSLLPLREQ